MLDIIAMSPRFRPELLPRRVMRGCVPFISVTSSGYNDRYCNWIARGYQVKGVESYAPLPTQTPVNVHRNVNVSAPSQVTDGTEGGRPFLVAGMFRDVHVQGHVHGARALGNGRCGLLTVPPVHRYAAGKLRAPGKNGVNPSRSRRCKWGWPHALHCHTTRKGGRDGKERSIRYP